MIILHNARYFSTANFLGKFNKIFKHVPGKQPIRELSSFKETFKFSELEETIASPDQRKPKPDPNMLVFGQKFCDHMLEVEWEVSKGWGVPRIQPFHNFAIHPASKVLHYAQEVIEGMKAFRTIDGKVALFRPMLHINRLLSSSKRAALPEFDPEEFSKCLKKLISIDQEWVPASNLSSLYIRPTFIGIEPTLGISASEKALLYVICSPVGSYFRSGIREPVSLFASPHYVRSWPGGIGNKKMGSNYAITLYAQELAKEKGFDQVLWLFGDDHQLTEVGAMNIFLLLINKNNEKELVTPPLNGTILPGVIRQSILELMQEWNEFKVSERIVTMGEVVNAVHENRLLEVFGSGTAAVVCSVKSISYQEQTINIPSSTESLSSRVFDALSGIQYGRIPSPWMDYIG